MLYPQNGDHIVVTDSVTSLHPMYKMADEVSVITETGWRRKRQRGRQWSSGHRWHSRIKCRREWMVSAPFGRGRHAHNSDSCQNHVSLLLIREARAAAAFCATNRIDENSRTKPPGHQPPPGQKPPPCMEQDPNAGNSRVIECRRSGQVLEFNVA